MELDLAEMALIKIFIVMLIFSQVIGLYLFINASAFAYVPTPTVF